MNAKISHLVFPLGSPEEFFYGIHSLLEPLALINLDHFFFVGMIWLELLHFDPGTSRKQTRKGRIHAAKQMGEDLSSTQHPLDLTGLWNRPDVLQNMLSVIPNFGTRSVLS